MASDNWVPALHFRELHLLPRVIFAMGAVTFVVGLIGHDLELTLFGAGVVFAGVAFNGIVVIFRIGYEPDGKQHPWLTKFLFNPAIAIALAAGCIYLSAHLHSCDSLPSYFYHDIGKPVPLLTK